ncbi:hypothetical protein [Streptomyces aureus]|uniref:hypothetical protein n=1 Tax=Streptomyces aureus TaxID=193461 RepID=UPI0036A87E71
MSRKTFRMQRDQEQDQALALAFAVVLLTGSVLMMSCWLGPLTTFAVVAVFVVTAYAAPSLARRLVLRRALRRLLQSLPDA